MPSRKPSQLMATEDKRINKKNSIPQTKNQKCRKSTPWDFADNWVGMRVFGVSPSDRACKVEVACPTSACTQSELCSCAHLTSNIRSQLLGSPLSPRLQGTLKELGLRSLGALLCKTLIKLSSKRPIMLACRLYTLPLQVYLSGKTKTLQTATLQVKIERGRKSIKNSAHSSRPYCSCFAPALKSSSTQKSN